MTSGVRDRSVLVRLSDDELAALKLLAERNHRSVGAQVRFLVEREIELRESKAAA